MTNQKRLTVKQTAEILGTSQEFVRLAMQQDRLPIGTAVKMSSVWTYFIMADKLNEYLGGQQK